MCLSTTEGRTSWPTKFNPRFGVLLNAEFNALEAREVDAKEARARYVDLRAETMTAVDNLVVEPRTRRSRSTGAGSRCDVV